MTRDRTSFSAASVTSLMARLNASSLARDGFVVPLNLRTNCKAEARISSSVAGGSKLASVLMFRHMTLFYKGAGRLRCRRLQLHGSADFVPPTAHGFHRPRRGSRLLGQLDAHLHRAV